MLGFDVDWRVVASRRVQSLSLCGWLVYERDRPQASRREVLRGGTTVRPGGGPGPGTRQLSRGIAGVRGHYRIILTIRGCALAEQCVVERGNT
jgi:hypothetical protein